MRYTEIKVYPKNWEKNIKANLNKEWYLYYEFDKKQIRFKSGVNCCKTLEEKQNFTRYLIDNEYRNLKNGYNPITKEFINPYDSVSEHTPFILALKIASKKIKVSKSTLVGVENAIKIIEQIALKTGHANIEISKIRKRDVRIMMDIVLEQKYSNDKYNKIKSYLGILYNYFVDMEIFEHNYIHYIRKLPHTPKKREIYREDDIEKINSLKDYHYELWRFLVIFHSSQSRLSELREVKINDIDMKNQTFTIFEKKGKNYKDVMKPINIHTEYLWKELLKEKKKGDIYLFGENFRPSENPLTKDKFDSAFKYWKKKLGITKTAYALRHTFANNIANEFGIEVAQKVLGHTSQRTTEIYAVDYRENLVKEQSKLRPLFL